MGIYLKKIQLGENSQKDSEIARTAERKTKFKLVEEQLKTVVIQLKIKQKIATKKEAEES